MSSAARAPTATRPSEGNAFLSAAGNVSGLGSTVPPANLTACTMIFKGATNNALTLYARAPVATDDRGATTRRPTPGARRRSCSPAALTHQPAASPYDWTLNVPNTHTSNPGPGRLLRDPYAWSRLPGAVPGWGIPHRMQGTWDYTAAGDPNDTHVATDPCP